jgi:hypothetical protein
MRFAKWVFLLRGFSGVIMIAPLYFEDRFFAGLPASDQSPGVLLRLRRLMLGLAGHVHRDRLRPCSLPDGDAAGRAGEGEFCRYNSRAVRVRASAGRVAWLCVDGRDVAGVVRDRIHLDAEGISTERVAGITVPPKRVPAAFR